MSCTDSGPPEPGVDPDGLGDEVDDAAKADGAAFPGGLYTLGYIEDSDYPQFEELDLRANKTFYRTFGMLSDAGDGNYEMGWSYTRGTFKFSSNSRTHKTYIRFYEDGKLYDVWEYKLNGTKLVFPYRTDGYFDMKRVAAPAKAWVTAVKGRVESTLADFPKVDEYADGVSQGMRETLLQWKDRSPAPQIQRTRVDYKYAYVVTGGNELELYAASGQLVGFATREADGTLSWDDEL